jgi:signal peptidase I
MLPALWPGDILVVRRGSATPATGDIVLFLRYRRLFAHRVVRTTESELITRGDALPDRDPPMPVAEVLGVVVRIIRDDSRPVSAAPPSFRQRMVAFAIRRSEAIYRLVLRWHGARVKRGWNDGEFDHRRPR